ncbi:MAG: C1 family peptidase [Planctomycetaceae bacterium]|nr:C1 family peptidase [Planctomycetaceae bacterium]
MKRVLAIFIWSVFSLWSSVDAADSLLSAVGVGSSFSASTSLSKAAKSHDLKLFLESQNGDWTVIDPLMLKEKHPDSLDRWVKILVDRGTPQPAVIWYQKNAGKVHVLSVDPLSDATTEADLLKLAKSHVPETKGYVTIKGRQFSLGLNAAPKNKKPRIGGKPVRSVSEALTPLAEADYPIGVDLLTQFQYVKDQGNYGTCVLNATCAAYEAACYRTFGAKNSIEFSPSFLAVRTNGWNGTWAADALDVLMNTGVVSMAAQPNYSHRLPIGWKQTASQHKALGVYGPPDSNTIGYVAAALAKGLPVLVGISVGNGFEPDHDGFITYARGAGRSVNHEVVVVGGFVQHDGKRFWRMKNSWGADWGPFGDGTAYLEDKFLDDGDNDFWVIVVPSAAESYQFDSPTAAANGPATPADACPDGHCDALRQGRFGRNR